MNNYLKRIYKTFVYLIIGYCLMGFTTFFTPCKAGENKAEEVFDKFTRQTDAISNKNGDIWEQAWKICLVFSGFIGLAGAMICYSKWQQGDPHVTHKIFAWLGACGLFLLMGIFLKMFVVDHSHSVNPFGAR